MAWMPGGGEAPVSIEELVRREVERQLQPIKKDIVILTKGIQSALKCIGDLCRIGSGRG